MIASFQLVARKNPAFVTFFLGISALAVVGSAWLFQLAGYLPCQLCLWQRIPYYIAGPILLGAALIAIFGFWSTSALRVVLLFVGLIFIASTFLAAFHSGVEWGFWPGPTSCGAGGDFSTINASDLLDVLSTTRPASCNEAAGRFLGLSFAGWNTIASIALSAASFVSAAAISNHPNNTK
ncbi:disulfide bond formation protein B [Pararhizobium sp. IMCC21322]|uniref:disulfide bond formation protein B n=1 Tax=Pararhizobium sp. IMCC21322 TaxID=3067903 RepID=UPI00353182CC